MGWGRRVGPSGPSGDYIPAYGWDVRRVTGSLTLSAPWLQTRICKLTFQKLLRGFAAQTVLRRLCLPLPAKIVFRRQNFGDFLIRFEGCEVTRRYTHKIRTLCKIFQSDARIRMWWTNLFVLTLTYLDEWIGYICFVGISRLDRALIMTPLSMYILDYIQLWKMNVIPLVNKPYVNEVILNGQNLY